jgi:hypothetical protein
MVKRNGLDLKKLDVAFQYMKTRSMVDNLTLLPLGNNIVICNQSDNYRVFISSNPEARITRNNFSELPKLDCGKWIEYWSLKEKTDNIEKNHPLAKDKMISEFVTEKINKFVNPLYQRMEEEEQKRLNQMNELVVETRENWKEYIEKIVNT